MNEVKRKNSQELKEMEIFLSDILRISFDLIKNDVQEVDPKELKIQQIPEILQIVSNKILQKEKEALTMREELENLKNTSNKDIQLQSDYADQVFQKLLQELHE